MYFPVFNDFRWFDVDLTLSTRYWDQTLYGTYVGYNSNCMHTWMSSRDTDLFHVCYSNVINVLDLAPEDWMKLCVVLSLASVGK